MAITIPKDTNLVILSFCGGCGIAITEYMQEVCTNCNYGPLTNPAKRVSGEFTREEAIKLYKALEIEVNDC